MVTERPLLEQMEEACVFLKAEGISSPEVGVVLGTGLGELVGLLTDRIEIEYSRIPHFPLATVEHHKGRLIFGKIAGRKVLVMQGRFHFYEGHTMDKIVFPLRVMRRLGIQTLFLSNVAGGIHPNLKKGDVVLIEDHINLQSSGPLIGPNVDAIGSRFPDMSSPYDKGLSQLLLAAGRRLGQELKRGIYVAVNGPQLETRAEYRYLRIIGADLVGMSTVPEVIAANHMGLPCCALSIITDECDPDQLAPIQIGEIIAIAGRGDKVVTELFKIAIGDLPIGSEAL